MIIPGLNIERIKTDICGHAVAVYLADITPLEDAELFGQIYSASSAERRAKTDRMKYDRDKRLSLGAEYLFMTACDEYGIDYNAAALSVGEEGKPDFANGSLHFNLSHSGSYVMCAVSKLPVGCDIEGGRDAGMKIARRFFSEREIAVLEACEENERAEKFFEIWTLKESFIKCIGRGLKQPLDSFTVCDGTRVVQSVDDAVYETRTGRIGAYCHAVCIKL